MENRCQAVNNIITVLFPNLKNKLKQFAHCCCKYRWIQITMDVCKGVYHPILQRVSNVSLWPQAWRSSHEAIASQWLNIRRNTRKNVTGYLSFRTGKFVSLCQCAVNLQSLCG